MKAIGTALLVGLAAAPAVSAYDMMTSRGAGMGRTLVFSRPAASALVNLPAAGLAPGGWHIEGGYNRRFELADLDQLYLAAAYRVRSFTLALGASQFGRTDLYAEQLIKGSVGVSRGRVTAGASLSALQVQIGDGYGGLRAATLGASVALRWPRFHLGLSGDNLTRPRLFEYSLPSEPQFALYGEFEGGGSYSITGRVTWERLQSPQFAFGQLIRLSPRGDFFWGVAFNPLEYGGGIEVNVLSGSIGYAASVHPVLGVTHTVSFSYGSKSARPKSKEPEEF